MGMLMQPVDRGLCEAVLMGMKAEVNDETIAHIKVLLEVFQLYQERTAKHGDTWKELGALNNLGRVVTKVNRLRHQYWDKQMVVMQEFPPDLNSDLSGRASMEDLDDAYDGINYMTFFIRQAIRGDWTCG